MRIAACVAAAVAAGLVLAASTFAQSAGGLEIQKLDSGYLVSDGGARVLFYQRAPKSLGGKFERAHYIHPLYDLDGHELTEDFPVDHLHHRGIFWTWHVVSVLGRKLGDPWMAEGFSWNVSEVESLRIEGRISGLRSVVLWQSPHWVDGAGRPKPLVKETATIRVHRATADHRKIDFGIELVALEEGVALGGSEDDKGYGGFSARIRLPEDVRFTGRKGAVKPEVMAVDAGPWVDLSGSLGKPGQVSGVAILAHPSLPVFPPPWILRDSKSMQNAVYPGRNPAALSRTTPLLLRYRIVIHRGPADPAKVNRWQAEYAREP